MQTAHDIYQARLDAVSRAFWERDFDSVLAGWAFPSFIETDDTVLRLKTPEDYLPTITNFRNSIESYGATAYFRVCREALFSPDDPNRIEGVHEAYVLNGAVPVVDPYLSHSTLIRQDGKWLCVAMRGAVKNKPLTFITNPKPKLGGASATAPHKETQS